MIMGVGRILTPPSDSNPWGRVTFRGVYRRCYFDPTRFLESIYGIENTYYVYVQETKRGLIALHLLGQG